MPETCGGAILASSSDHLLLVFFYFQFELLAKHIKYVQEHVIENIVLGFSPQHSSMFLQRGSSWNSKVKIHRD